MAVFAIFGMSNMAEAAMKTSNYSLDNSFDYAYDNFRQSANYNQESYDNSYANTGSAYNNFNTGYVPTNYNGYNNQSNQTQNVYGSDPSAPKPATVLATTSGSTNNTTKTNTVSNNTTTKNTTTKNTTVKEDNTNVVNSEQAVSANTVSGSDLENGNSIVALSAYGTDRFLPDTILEWVMVFFLILIVIILFRLITKKKHDVEVQA